MIDLTKFESLLTSLVADWNRVKPAVGWLTINPQMAVGFKFVLSGIEQFVGVAATLDIPGTDKKAIVKDMANKLFNSVILAALPLWMKPFYAPLTGLFDMMLDGAIEFLVTKLFASLVTSPTTTTSKPK